MQVENDELEREARSVSLKFKKVFRLFRACHDLYSLSRKMTVNEIDELGNVIAWSLQGKLRYFVYRNRDPTLPELLSRVLSGSLGDPKDAFLPWIRRWMVGLSFHGEQGAESELFLFEFQSGFDFTRLNIEYVLEDTTCRILFFSITSTTLATSTMSDTEE